MDVELGRPRRLQHRHRRAGRDVCLLRWTERDHTRLSGLVRDVPAGSVNVFRVHPGDVIDATESYSAGKFTLTISDLSIGKSTTHTAGCGSCQRASAEWIIERPELCNNSFTKCFLTALADFRTSTMAGAVARVDGGSAKPITGFTNYSIDMIQPLQRGFISLDGVGPVRTGADAFTTTWQRAGTIVPIPL
jgi:Peptidase A4 family